MCYPRHWQTHHTTRYVTPKISTTTSDTVESPRKSLVSSAFDIPSCKSSSICTGGRVQCRGHHLPAGSLTRLGRAPSSLLRSSRIPPHLLPLRAPVRCGDHSQQIHHYSLFTDSAIARIAGYPLHVPCTCLSALDHKRGSHAHSASMQSYQPRPAPRSQAAPVAWIQEERIHGRRHRLPVPSPPSPPLPPTPPPVRVILSHGPRPSHPLPVAPTAWPFPPSSTLRLLRPPPPHTHTHTAANHPRRCGGEPEWRPNAGHEERSRPGG